MLDCDAKLIACQVEYVTLDLGAAVDPKLLQTAMTYQLIVGAFVGIRYRSVARANATGHGHCAAIS
jgi:hypothetical protein